MPPIEANIISDVNTSSIHGLSSGEVWPLVVVVAAGGVAVVAAGGAVGVVVAGGAAALNCVLATVAAGAVAGGHVGVVVGGDHPGGA